jgi:malonyl-CoA/methylmalonyl-CoA synthetase
MMSNLYDYLFPSGRSPDHVVLKTHRADLWTRGRMEELAAKMAGALRQCGLEKGGRLVAQIDKSPEAICLYLACLKLGAVWVPLNTSYTLAESGHIIDDAEPTVVVRAPEVQKPQFRKAERSEFDLDTDGSGSLMTIAANSFAVSETQKVDFEDLAAILYTSGTTGKPKGAMLTHANLRYSTKAMGDVWKIAANDVLLHALPIFHAHGLFIAINPVMKAGGTIKLLPKFDPDLVIEGMRDATVFMGVPTFYSRLLADPRLDRNACSDIRLFTCGSAPLSAATFADFQERTGHSILERYGMTETTIIASNPLDGERIPGSVGFALPGLQTSVRTSSGESVAASEIGELVVRGPNVFKGYWNMPGLTATEFTLDGFFKTGDLARMDADGRIWIVGRNKDLIISGGYNVYPQEVETALNKIHGVRDCAVVGIPHPDFGEGVIAVLEQEPGSAKLEASTVLSLLSSQLAKYKLPKFVISTEQLPRNALGKVQKNELRRQYVGMFDPPDRPST